MEKFTPHNAAILLIDHQDGLVSGISSQDKKTVVNNVRFLARLGNDMNIPLVVTSSGEEKAWPGRLIKDIEELAPKAYANRIRRGGTSNSFDDAGFEAAVKATGKKNLIVAGLTTDVCLFHTVEGALKEGYNVQVVSDGCGSSNPMIDQITFDRLRGMGVIVTGANMLLAELYTDLGTADGARARAIKFGNRI